MHVVTHFQCFWQCGGYTVIQTSVAALRILGLGWQFLDISPVYLNLEVSWEAQKLTLEKEQSVHCIAMLLPNTNWIKKPRVSNEYPANTTQTGSLMLGVEVSNKDCGLGWITSQRQFRDFREFMTPCLALQDSMAKQPSGIKSGIKPWPSLPKCRARTCCHHLQLLLQSGVL
jgi:hypothetical protein